MTKAVLSLGSNIENRVEHLTFAVNALAANAAVRITNLSPVYQTQPVGGVEQADFLNIVVLAEIAVTPLELLEICQGIEALAGRTRDIRWGPRTLDIDILAVGDQTVNDAHLQLPHPRAHERAFVLVPWNDVDPTAWIPGHGLVSDLRASVGESTVRHFSDPISCDVVAQAP